MADMIRFEVHARRFSDGWELHFEGMGVTQVASLQEAEDQVRDFLATVFEASGDRERLATLDTAVIDVVVDPITV